MFLSNSNSVQPDYTYATLRHASGGGWRSSQVDVTGAGSSWPWRVSYPITRITPIAGQISTASLVCELSTGGDTHPNSPTKERGKAARKERLMRLFSAASSKVRVRRTSGATRASQGGRF